VDVCTHQVSECIQKIVLVMHGSEVATVIMRVEEERHVAGVHNITD
jgi:hypothetical protein